LERRVFISVTSDRALDERRRAVKAAIIDRVGNAGYAPQVFWEAGMAADLAWTFDNVERVMRDCVGAVVIGYPRWSLSDADQTVSMVGEYNHY
jgi:hypothetical protein